MIVLNHNNRVNMRRQRLWRNSGNVGYFGLRIIEKLFSQQLPSDIFFFSILGI